MPHNVAQQWVHYYMWRNLSTGASPTSFLIVGARLQHGSDSRAHAMRCSINSILKYYMLATLTPDSETILESYCRAHIYLAGRSTQKWTVALKQVTFFLSLV